MNECQWAAVVAMIWASLATIGMACIYAATDKAKRMDSER